MASRLSLCLFKRLSKGVPLERISGDIASGPTESWLVGFEAFALLQPVGLNEFLIVR